jgi:hypothetical protein
VCNANSGVWTLNGSCVGCVPPGPGTLVLNLSSPFDGEEFDEGDIIHFIGNIQGGSPPFDIELDRYDGSGTTYHQGSNRSFNLSFEAMVDTSGNFVDNRICVYSADGQSICEFREVAVWP